MVTIEIGEIEIGEIEIGEIEMRSKNDADDAAAISEAIQRPTMRSSFASAMILSSSAVP
jgi:hypothetical protein